MSEECHFCREYHCCPTCDTEYCGKYEEDLDLITECNKWEREKIE
jgi:hypothetical protein